VGVAGWVRNRPDGAVEAVFEGDPEAVDQLVEFCRRGPSRAEVTSAEVVEEEPEGLSGFEVR
jgi:acylphosphatase